MHTAARARRGTAVVWAAVLLAGVVSASPVGAEENQRNSILIETNDQFDGKHGVRSGSGTLADPYVISDWETNRIEIHDTDRYVVIRDNLVHGQLTLNWVGDRVTLVDNIIGDLRVNENVKRTGEATSGLIARNRFDVVGQLRHWDGVFRNNIVGQERAASFWEQVPLFGGGERRGVNFDGFNGAHFTDNVIYGYVEARLHGHHHSSGFTGHSHYHGTEGDSHGAMDHSQRYHRVMIHNNTIYSRGPYALVYTDTAHSANDRTAASEQNEALNLPHVHHTKVMLAHNKLVGSGISVEIFNADDRRHMGTSTGEMKIIGNKITLRPEDENDYWDYVYGIDVWAAKDVKLTIADNLIRGAAEQESLTDGAGAMFRYEKAGISLHEVTKGWIYLVSNTVINREIGISAANFDNVQWWIKGLSTKNVDQAVSYDNSSNPPNREG